MALSAAQLESWSQQGAVATSRDTYEAVRKCLSSASAPYSAQLFEIHLQGSYANDTNVFRDSDVDVVICQTSSFYHDAPTMGTEQNARFEAAYPGEGGYGQHQFKNEVFNWVSQQFGGSVELGRKAIYIPGLGNRRDCDVLPCSDFRYYYEFQSLSTQRYVDGICFFLPEGDRVINFPKQHRINCTSKNQETGGNFKKIVRIFKNARNRMVDVGVMRSGVAPSYFVEGMLWNVPSNVFTTNFSLSYVSALNWLAHNDRAIYRCANGIHLLLDGERYVSWNSADYLSYLNAMLDLWNRGP